MNGLAHFWHENRLAILIIAALFVAYLALRSSPTEIASIEGFLASLRQGQPTIVMFYSNA